MEERRHEGEIDKASSSRTSELEEEEIDWGKKINELESIIVE